MMLKIREVQKGKTPRWTVIANVESISYEIFKAVEAYKRREGFIESTKYGSVRTYQSYIDPSTGKDAKYYNLLELVIHHSNKNLEVIYTDDSVYMMNDNGKTTELIYP